MEECKIVMTRTGEECLCDVAGMLQQSAHLGLAVDEAAYKLMQL